MKTLLKLYFLYYCFISGLLRRNDEANRFPLGVLPLGRTNSLGNNLFPGGEGVERVKQLIQACMAIIENNTTWKDVMKIEPLAVEDETPIKPIYAMTSIEWGAFRDTLAKKDKYWIYGPLRGYVSYIFNGYKDSLSWNCSGTLKFTPPCAGCSNCLIKKPEVKRKWAFFIPTTEPPQKEVIEIVNPECAVANELCFKSTDFRIRPENNDGLSILSVGLGKNKYSYTEFVSEGWRRLNGNSETPEAVKARTVEIQPLENRSDVVIAIDQEEFDVKPVKVTVLPKMVKFFCKSEVKD